MRPTRRHFLLSSAAGVAGLCGYAESADGLDWARRDDEVGLSPPPEGWDGAMQAYPMVLRDGDRFVMLYNGNGYGASGFGCATAEASDE